MKFSTVVGAVLAGLSITAVLPSAARAEWPTKVFAPYAFLTDPNTFSINKCREATGQKYFTLAFILADSKGDPMWGGNNKPLGDFYKKEIDDLRAAGGDVIISFGGAEGTELAVADKTDDALLASYEKVINAYQFTWLDFDIEGKTLDDADANARRNRVIAKLQQMHPQLRVSYTLAADPNGMLEPAKKLLADARKDDTKIMSADIMVMDFGPNWSKGKADSTVCIETSDAVRQQLLKINPAIDVGLCALIGVNDVKSEVFRQADARILLTYAQQNPWICSMAFWCTNRDVESPDGKPAQDSSGIPQQQWDFTRIFQQFMK